MDEEVVVEGGDVVEDGFVIKEKFGEEGKALREELVFFAVDLVDGVEGARVDFFCLVEGCVAQDMFAM